MRFFDGNKLEPSRLVLAAVTAIAGAAALSYVLIHPPKSSLGSVDFNAYYCSGRVLASGMDPYRYGPIHACEVRNAVPATANAVVPAPFPPYVIAAFEPLARLPFAQASILWQIVLLGAALVVTWAILDLTGLPLLLVGTSVLVCVWMPSVLSGALAPIPIASLCVAAVSLARSRWTAATLCMAVACIEPHVAAPALLASFVIVPPMRPRIALLGAAIAAASLIAGGLLDAEYVRLVLPAHAASELGTEGQFGLSSLLNVMGVPQRAALIAGSVQYGAFALGGIWLAHRLRRRLPEGIVLIPLALAVTGGTFVHLTQVSAALPLAFVVASQTAETLAWLALALVAVPWQAVVNTRVPLVAGIALFAVVRQRFGAIWAAVSGLAGVSAIVLAQKYAPVSLAVRSIPDVPPSALAEFAWKQFANQFPPTALSMAAHALTYAGLLGVILSTARLAMNPAPSTAPRGVSSLQRTPIRTGAPPAG